MKTLILLITNPAESFKRLKSEEKFQTVAFVALSTLMLVNLILNVPVNTKLALATLSNMEGLPEAQVDAGMQVVYNLRFFSMAGLFVWELVVLFLNVAALFAVACIAGMKIPFGKVANLIILCYVVQVIGGLVDTSLLYLRGIDAIGSPSDVQMTSLNMLFPASDMTLFTLLSYLNPFQVWYAILLCWGLKIVTGESYAKSFAVGIVYWLITVAVPVVSAYLSQSMMQKFGISF
jgi:hypothetical protein